VRNEKGIITNKCILQQPTVLSFPSSTVSGYHNNNPGEGEEKLRRGYLSILEPTQNERHQAEEGEGLECRVLSPVSL
jgi:hypothetical protein